MKKGERRNTCSTGSGHGVQAPEHTKHEGRSSSEGAAHFEYCEG